MSKCRSIVTLGSFKLVIRNVENEDIDDWKQIARMYDNESKVLSTIFEDFDSRDGTEYELVDEWKDSTSKLILIAQVGEEIVGGCMVYVDSRKRYRHIGDCAVFVKDNFRAKGIGNSLIRECVSWSRGHGVEVLQLDVFADNKKGLSLFQRLGFQIDGIREKAVKTAEGKYKTVISLSLLI